MSTEFSNNFDDVQPEDRYETEPGRAAVVRFAGPQGDLDISSIYLHAREAKEERASHPENLDDSSPQGASARHDVG